MTRQLHNNTINLQTNSHLHVNVLSVPPAIISPNATRNILFVVLAKCLKNVLRSTIKSPNTIKIHLNIFCRGTLQNGMFALDN